MSFSRLLIANRGEIAVRIIRAASDIGVATVAVYATDDASSLHTRLADQAIGLAAAGPAAYLDADRLVAVALQTGCDAVHPGYGFLSESPSFARKVRDAGLAFIGPRPELLELFGAKSSARELAAQCSVPVLKGTNHATSLQEAGAFLASLGDGQAIMIKAIAGGGGRGMRVVRNADELEASYRRCQSEANHAFGNDELYVEQYMPHARHIEVQVVGDGRDAVHLGERECSIQRRNQKLVEVAPSPTLTGALRERLCESALRMARKAGYENLGTFEFLVSTAPDAAVEFAFIEVNPRLQVEHTVTEEVLGLDLVRMQLEIAAGATLSDLGMSAFGATPRGHAIELRINMETIDEDGTTRPSGGVLAAFDTPSGPGIRVDTFGYTGYATNPRYDSLLAKLIVHSPSARYADAVQRASRALREFRIEGLATNAPLLLRLLEHPAFRANEIDTGFLDAHLPALLSEDGTAPRELFFRSADPAGRAARPRVAGSLDPLAVFAGDASMAPLPGSGIASPSALVAGPEGALPLVAPMQGTIVAIDVAEGERVRLGQQILVLEAMKMEHPVVAEAPGIVCRIDVTAGETVYERTPLVYLIPEARADEQVEEETTADLDHVRADLAEVLERHAALTDERRPDAVARRRKTGQRTARENLADLLDPGSFVEYGGLAVAAQRHRRPIDELLKISPADGMIAGLGTVNGSLFGEERARCAALAYDYTVFAGTQGVINHKKKDRLLALAEKWSLPIVLFAEGGGGRPGDEWPTPAGLDTTTFNRLGALSGLVPTIGVASGRCFAGNAALLGSCDVIIATANTNIGMGGPAMIEGGGLGVFRPEDVGPMSVQVANGVVDIAVSDEAEGVSAARRYLSYFQGALDEWGSADQRLLRQAIPENRLRAYDIRTLIATLADTGSVLELRPSFGPGMITALIRLEGRPVGLIANNSRHLGGAIDADGADKAARFIRLCDAFDLPIVSLCDTPGMMVGPEIERSAQVRHVSRMFVAAANVSVPIFTVVLRKGYGLGALAMTGGSSQASFMIVAWPTGEFGAMGLEGAVKLGYRKELAAIEDPDERRAWFDQMVARSYEENKALSGATFLEIDDVIDPRDTRRHIVRGLKCLPPRLPSVGRKYASLDVW